MQQLNKLDKNFNKYKSLLLELKKVVSESEHRVVREVPDDLFIDNVNFFVKSYLISVCSYIEACLQDLAFLHTLNVTNKIKSANIPHNLIHWRTNPNFKKHHYKYSNFVLDVTKKDISESISANPYKTEKLFQNLGVNLLNQQAFLDNKELMHKIVEKRNNIVHHNDTAADVSFGDLKSYIDVSIEYMASIKEAVKDT
ncbi:hypothetical protein C7Y70_20045 [Pseudoalteromonas sp. KS88]|uniref:HEPN domain-containing protein n=1 Tax=Pseudoalteromonas sp. KS88 TaxID=2109918 RepID=UPI0010802B38|nr:HEPN domain-containing protein [Pseudoalteromonas sp. KS88]TGE76034.1 hypothetical protein C7Y70_20045 [Pseudoalteromonas sp. KS88]